MWKFDRLARDLIFAVTTTDTLLKEHNIKIRSVTEPIETDTPYGRMLFSILASLAELERESIRQRMTTGRKLKAEKGGYAGGEPPYGYRANNGRLEINPNEAPTVQTIFRLRKEGLGSKRIAAMLNELGIPSRSGGQWTYSTIDKMLKNKKYRGQVDYFFEDEGLHIIQNGQHSALIEEG